VPQLFVLGACAMYVKPEVTRYSGTELLDLMGPVETGYVDYECREISVVPESGFIVTCGSSLDITFQWPIPEPPTGWDHVEYRVTPPDLSSCGQAEESMPEGLLDVDEDKGINTLSLPGAIPDGPSDFNFCDLAECSDPGVYTLELWFVDSDDPPNTTTPCRTFPELDKQG
jgi:hypothetical protein